MVENEGKACFPLIYKVARKYLVIPGTSVPSEQVFSTAGQILSKRRNRLSDEHAADLLFIRENIRVKN